MEAEKDMLKRVKNRERAERTEESWHKIEIELSLRGHDRKEASPSLKHPAQTHGGFI